MSNVHFIDTSVLVELLNIPKMNDRHAQAQAEYEALAAKGDVFVLPVAVLVETGNHIAHISDGTMRYQIAVQFSALVQKAVNSGDNWNTVPSISPDTLESIMKQFPVRAQSQTGFGDISIIEQFNDYWKNRQPIGEMRIWAFDGHLKGYAHTGGLARRKNK